MKKQTILPFVLAICLFFISSLACSKSGEIMMSADATQQAQEENEVNLTPEEEVNTDIEISGPQPGETVYLTGKAYLISIVDEPGSIHIIASQQKGVEVTIIKIVEHEGEFWYFVDTPTGEGWVSAENITTEKK